jgi:hypothetical protein
LAAPAPYSRATSCLRSRPETAPPTVVLGSRAQRNRRVHPANARDETESRRRRNHETIPPYYQRSRSVSRSAYVAPELRTVSPSSRAQRMMLRVLPSPQCRARRGGLQLCSPPALVGEAFARLVPGARHGPLGPKTGVQPFFTAGTLQIIDQNRDPARYLNSSNRSQSCLIVEASMARAAAAKAGSRPRPNARLSQACALAVSPSAAALRPALR